MFLGKNLLALGVAAVLTACGGGGGGDENKSQTDVKPTVFSGKVIDGYVVGATVCLDVNSNLKCDTNEPQAITTEGGNFSFEYTGNISGMQVIAEVPKGAMDNDLGVVTDSYSLLAPAALSSVVTPLTTLVSSEMLSNKVSALDAEATIKTNLNLKTELIGYDFKQAGDADTAAVAQITAAAIAKATSELTINPGIIEFSLTSGQILKQAIDQVSTNILPKLISSDGTVSVNGISQASVIAQISNLVTNVISGQIQNIVASTKSGDGAVVDMATVLSGSGVVFANKENGRYINAQEILINFSNALQAEWISLNAQGFLKFGQERYRILIDNTWFSRYDSGNELIFDGKAWVKGIATNLTVPVINGNCIELPLTEGNVVAEIVCGVGKDISGKKIADINLEICKQGENTIQSCDQNAVFPLGSIGYDLTVSSKQDSYRLYFDPSWSGYQTIDTNDIYGFIAYAKLSPQFIGGSCQVGLMIESYDNISIPKVESGVAKWGLNTSGGCVNPTVNYTETTPFEIITVGGKELVKIVTPNIVRANDMFDGEAYMVFGTHESGVWPGSFSPAKFKRSFKFTGDVELSPQVVSPVLFNFLQNQRGLPAYPYMTD